MSIIVGSARFDEHKKPSGGQPGDQTGLEVSTQPYYLHKKGWYVLRAKSVTVANRIAQDMQWACKNNHIGYDQSQKNTLYNEVKKHDFNCSKVTKNVETDCSSLVRVCVKYAGIELGNITTATEKSKLLETGKFYDATSKVDLNNGKGLKTGDILVTKTPGHTVVVVSVGSHNGYNQSEKYKAKVNVNTTLNVRTQPTVDSQVTSFSPLKNGTIISVCDNAANGWLYISYKGKYGFVYGKYVEKV